MPSSKDSLKRNVTVAGQDPFDTRVTTPFERRAARKEAIDTQTTTPFDRGPGQQDLFDSRTTTPFERKNRVSSIDVDLSDLDEISFEKDRAKLLPWVIMLAGVGLVVASLWGR